ncbi:unnamed protein product [Brassica oleracea var. botrytis]
MSNNVIIHFKCEGQMHSLVFKNEVDDITLSMVEARICKKLAFDESSVKLKLSYIPLLVGCEEQFIISDDEDLCGYPSSFDKENRLCILYVEIIRRSELPEQLPRAGKQSSLVAIEEMLEEVAEEVNLDENAGGKEDESVGGKEDENAGGKKDENADGNVGNGRKDLEMCDRYGEAPPLGKPGQFMEAWEDGLGLKIQQEFVSKGSARSGGSRRMFEKFWI